MKVLLCTIEASSCNEILWNNYHVFGTENAAMKYLYNEYYGYVEQKDLPPNFYRFFEHIQPQCDKDGIPDDPIITKIEFKWVDVIE